MPLTYNDKDKKLKKLWSKYRPTDWSNTEYIPQFDLLIKRID